MPWNGLKIEIYDSHQYSCSPEKVFPYELEPLGSLLSPIFGHTYSKWNVTIQCVLKMKNAIKLANLFLIYFDHTGCPKNGKYHEMCLKLRYDMNQSI